MQDLNVIALGGRLVKDATFKEFDNGSGVIQFSIAVTTTTKKDDKYEDVGNFFNVKYYKKNPSKMAEYLKKGTKVTVQGTLHQDRWEKDGQKQSMVCIYADRNGVLLCGSKSDNSSGPSDNDMVNDGDFPEDVPF